MLTNIYLFVKEISDTFLQENFKRLQEALKSEPILNPSFLFYSITTTGAVTDATFKHNLSYVPKDVLLMNVSAAQTVTFNYDLFDATNIFYTTTGACTFRFFLGRYGEK